MRSFCLGGVVQGLQVVGPRPSHLRRSDAGVVGETAGSDDRDECLLIMGFASASQREDLQRLQHVFENISDLQVVVNVADGPTPPGVCEACVSLTE
ncbi:unnamed protein product [Cladocopium goreaui]|uniref:Cell division cycle protein 48-like n=1 Tax=Cladocopium goreaui TaxID=2562237 RepID=A0A9P1BQF8_9DINO|nr:unnamed protein product [Cladocopium goreaui]